MRKFRKIDPRMHNDEKYMALSLRGQKLFDYLLTHPNMTALGAMRATDYGICLELVNANTPNEFDRMIDEAFGKAFPKRLCRKRLWIPARRPGKGHGRYG